MKYSIIVLLMSLILTDLNAQQEAQYTQGQFNNNLVLNPAYAGYADCPRLGLRYRNQWAGFSGSPTTMNLTFDTDIKERLGLGTVFVYDQLGIENSFQAEMSLNYQLPVSTAQKSILAMGLKGGYNRISADFSRLSNVNTSDPLYDPALYSNLGMGYFGFGMLYYTERFFLGLSSPRLISIENTAGKTELIKPHAYFNTGYTFDIDDNVTLTPSILLKYQQTAPLEADIAMNMWVGNIGVGASYRTGDAFNTMIQYQYHKVIFGYSYDFTLSDMRSQTRGGHEAFIGFGLCKQKSPANPNGTINPVNVGRSNL